MRSEVAKEASVRILKDRAPVSQLVSDVGVRISPSKTHPRVMPILRCVQAEPGRLKSNDRSTTTNTGVAMQQTTKEMQRILDALLEALDTEAAHMAPAREDQRGERRTNLRAPCDASFFLGADYRVKTVDGVVRNIGFCGLSVVANPGGPISPGRPVEVTVFRPDHTLSHLAGTVAFCRQVADDNFEIGVEVKAAGECTILTHNVSNALSIYDWFSQALRVPE